MPRPAAHPHDGRQRAGRFGGIGRVGLRRGAGGAHRRHPCRRPRHYRIYVRLDRRPERRGAHAPQFPVGGSSRIRVPRRGAVRQPSTAAAVPAPRPLLRTVHPVLLDWLRRWRGRLSAGYEVAASRPALVQADLSARRAARVREGVQRRVTQGRHRFQGAHVRAGRPVRPRMVAHRAGRRQAFRQPARPARDVRDIGVPRGSRRTRPEHPVCGVRRGSAEIWRTSSPASACR